MLTERTQTVLLAPDAKTAEVYDYYKRVSSIYRRSTAAIGRTPTYKVSMSNARDYRLKNE